MIKTQKTKSRVRFSHFIFVKSQKVTLSFKMPPLPLHKKMTCTKSPCCALTWGFTGRVGWHSGEKPACVQAVPQTVTKLLPPPKPLGENQGGKLKPSLVDKQPSALRSRAKSVTTSEASSQFSQLTGSLAHWIHENTSPQRCQAVKTSTPAELDFIHAERIHNMSKKPRQSELGS